MTIMQSLLLLGLFMALCLISVEALVSPSTRTATMPIRSLAALPSLQSLSQPKSSSSTRLYHMGHSHSHHHHHDHSDDETEEQTPITPQQKQRRFRRRLALLAVVWVATCGTSLAFKQRLTRSDWTSFAIASIVLSSADKMRRFVRSNIQKLARLKDGIVKHSPAYGQKRQLFVNQKLQDDADEADRVTWLGAVINLVLSVAKLVVGITQHSSALVADAGHSLSDLVSDFITLWTVKIARLPADEDHPYGHWKFEAIGSLFLSLTLIATAISVGAMANKQLIEILQQSGGAAVSAIGHHHGHAHGPLVPGKLALVVAAISIASKEWLYRITKKVGEKIRSQVVIANAWHHRSDAYSSVLALASIAWARTGFVAADAAAGLLVAGMIGMTGGEILMESVQQLSDGASPGLQKEAEEHVQELLEKDFDVEKISFVKARQVGSLSLVEVELFCPTNLSTTASRAVEERWKFWLQQLHGYEAIVHAKPNELICPLLEKQQQDDYASEANGSDGTFLQDLNGYNQDDSATTTSTSSVPIVTTSAGTIETLAREQVRLFGGGSQVERVTVHYNPGFETSVDIILSSPPFMNLDSDNDINELGEESSLPTLVQNGATLKESLQSLIEIDKANIYWDLSSMTLPETTKLAP